MIEEVKKIINEILIENGEKTNVEMNGYTELRDLGLNSFDLATLTVKIEDKFDVDVFEDGLVSSLGEIVSILESNKYKK